MKPTEKLLREYVRQVLVEDDGGVYADLAGADAGSPYGMHYGSGDDLYKVFIKPFVDVVDTAAGKTKELSQKGQTVLKTAFETVATTLIPVLSDSYSEIFAHEKQEVEKVKQEYAEVYKANWDAFKDNDVLCAAFMYSPTAFLTVAMARKAPKAAARLVSVLSGGSLDKWVRKVLSKMSSGPAVTGLGVSSSGHSSMPMEAVLREDEQKPDASALLASKKVKAKLEQSSVVQGLEQKGKSVVRNTLQQVYKQAAGVMSARTLQDLQRKTGAQIKGLDTLQQVPEQERQKAEQAILAATKKSMKSFYHKNLEAQVKQAVEAGVPEAHPYVQDYVRTAKKIDAL